METIYYWGFDCVCGNNIYRYCNYQSATADTEEKFLQEIKSYPSYIMASNYHNETIYLNPLYICEISSVRKMVRKQIC